MAITEFSQLARSRLLESFPQFSEHLSEIHDHIEIDFPHPSIPLRLRISTDNDEISIFWDRTHRHIGMCENLPADDQIAKATAFLNNLFSGRMPFVKDSRWDDLNFYDDPTIYGSDPDEKITLITWNELKT